MDVTWRFRYVVYAPTDDEARSIWQEFHDVCESDNRKGRVRLASAAEMADRFPLDTSVVIVAASDRSEREVEIVWRGSRPTRAQLLQWAKAFISEEEMNTMMIEEAHKLAEERASAPKTLAAAVRRYLMEASAEHLEKLKATPEKDLWHYTGCTSGIRNLWFNIAAPPILEGRLSPTTSTWNEALLADCGTDDVDEASLMIIQEVWSALS